MSLASDVSICQTTASPNWKSTAAPNWKSTAAPNWKSTAENTWQSTAVSTWNLTASDSVWQFVSQEPRQDNPSQNFSQIFSPKQDQRINKMQKHYGAGPFDNHLATPQSKRLQKPNFNESKTSDTEIHLTTPQKYPQMEMKSSNVSKTQNNERTYSRGLESDRSENNLATPNQRSKKHLATPAQRSDNLVTTTPAQILSKKLLQSSQRSPGESRNYKMSGA